MSSGCKISDFVFGFASAHTTNILTTNSLTICQNFMFH